MKVVRGITTDFPLLARPKITLGTFDGVHVGHQFIFSQLLDWARETASPSVAITFDRRPRDTVERKSAEHITSLHHRLLLLEQLHLDLALVLEFDEALAACEPEDFVRSVLVERLHVGGILLGHDTRFGKHARGDIGLLRKLGEAHNFEVCSVPVVKYDGAPVSSTRVRQAITDGELQTAAKLLGRPVSAIGTVIRGTGRGLAWGYPTANLDLHHEVRLPEGVYATQAGLAGRWYNSVTNIGRPPSFQVGQSLYLTDEVIVETFLLDFSEDIYGRELEVRFIRRIRPERTFPSPCALAEAIAADVIVARTELQCVSLTPGPLV